MAFFLGIENSDHGKRCQSAQEPTSRTSVAALASSRRIWLHIYTACVVGSSMGFRKAVYVLNDYVRFGCRGVLGER